MSGLGQYLSGLRKARGYSIDEMARVTRVAPRYLEALEHDDLTGLPAPVFTKGYIRAYCQALGVQADEALGRYVEHTPFAVPAATSTAAARASDGKRPHGTLLISFALLLGFGLALFTVARYLQAGRPEAGGRQAALPSATETPAPSPPPPAVAPPRIRDKTTESPVVVPPPPAPAAPVAVVPSPPAVAPTPAPAPPPSPAAAVATPAPPLRLGSVVSPYRLVARTSEPTWLRVRTEDGRTSEEVIPPGEVREWVSNHPFVLTVGNAAGVTLELNGQKLPPLGNRGAVIG